MSNTKWPLKRRRRGRVLAVKLGLNPNSSSLGVDITFLLFGAAAVSLMTPVLSALLRWRRPADAPNAASTTNVEENPPADQ